jgi:hypothetical protein
VDSVLDGLLNFGRRILRGERLGCFDKAVAKGVQPKGVHLLRGIMEGSTGEVFIDIGDGLVQSVQDPLLRERLASGWL